MKLKKFTKNKKIKTIFIGSIIGILLVVGGISLYRSFAMYKVEKTFDVLQGTVPDFRKTKTYTEELLNGADPVLDEKGELVPVKIGDNGIVTKADVAQEWYSYEKKEWANAVILTDTGKNKEIKVGEKIEEQYIESYFVWIPKYRYKLFDMGDYPNITSVKNKSNQAVEIEFGLTDTVDDETKEEYKQCQTPMNEDKTQGLSGESGKCHVGDWMTHPAFISFKANGLWAGKFETSNNSNKVQIKPNKSSWRNLQISNAYNTSFDYKRDLDSHMMKNTEWGAVAYLTQSIYGRCTSNTCTEIAINSNNNYTTGYSNTNISYTDSRSVASSTTNNYSGIYDMSGGAWEFTMAVILDSNNEKPIYYLSGFNESSFPTTKKYYDIYKYHTNRTHWDRRILGDATGEVCPCSESGTHYSSMYDDYAGFGESNWPWIDRGGAKSYESRAGVFAYSPNRGASNVDFGFRIVLTPQ